jgi:hypothetical protein
MGTGTDLKNGLIQSNSLSAEVLMKYPPPIWLLRLCSEHFNMATNRGGFNRLTRVMPDKGPKVDLVVGWHGKSLTCFGDYVVNLF